MQLAQKDRKKTRKLRPTCFRRAVDYGTGLSLAQTAREKCVCEDKILLGLWLNP